MHNQLINQIFINIGKFIILLLPALIFNSCCDSNVLNDYDHTYDNYLPKQGDQKINFYYKSDTSKSESIIINSDKIEAEELGINGDGCTQLFNIRTLYLDIPKTDELSFTLSTGGPGDYLALNMRYTNDTSKYGDLGYYYYNDGYPDSIDAYLREIIINGEKFNNIMRFCFTSENSPDLNKIFIAEHDGFIMITYNNGDTLIRK